MRVDWSPDDDRILATKADGSVEIDEVDGSTRTLATGCLDARWLPDDRIITIDREGRIRYFPEDPKVRIDHRTLALRARSSERRDLLVACGAAAIAGNGSSYVVISRSSVFVRTPEDDARSVYWPLGAEYRVSFDTEGTTATLSPDGNLIAIGYRQSARQNNKGARPGRRGWLVIDRRRRFTKPDRGLLDRSWYDVQLARGPTLVAFDGACRRLAIAAPEQTPGIGVIRLPTRFVLDAASGKCTTYPRGSETSGARALALDDRGVIAAHAYGRRLRVDYLDAAPSGDSIVAVQDTLWIEPDCAEIDALAFSKDSRRIACLDARGRLEIVPVP